MRAAGGDSLKQVIITTLLYCDESLEVGPNVKWVNSKRARLVERLSGTIEGEGSEE